MSYDALMEARRARSRFLRGFGHQGFVKIGEETYPCELADISASGATLTVGALIDLPEPFFVQLRRGGKEVRRCSVVWDDSTREVRRVRVQFE